MLNNIDKIYALCLDKRRNLWKTLDEQFIIRGKEIEKFIVGKGEIFPKDVYSFIDPDIKQDQIDSRWNNSFSLNAYCCYLSHRAMLEKAKKDGVKTFLLLEDDCLLADNFDEIAKEVEKQINQQDLKWDMLYFGCNHTWGKTSDVSQNILKLRGGSYCWHCVAINQEHHDMIGHLLDLPPMGAFDWLTSLHTQTNEELNCYATWPSIALQRPGMSYVVGFIQNYTNFFDTKGDQT